MSDELKDLQKRNADFQVRKQIENSTRDWCRSMLESEEDFESFSHEQGRELQDPIAWNRCLDEVMKIVMDEDVLFKSNFAWHQMRDRIEKLRR